MLGDVLERINGATALQLLQDEMDALQLIPFGPKLGGPVQLTPENVERLIDQAARSVCFATSSVQPDLSLRRIRTRSRANIAGRTPCCYARRM